MAGEEKSQKIVETYKAVAAGIASVVAALFTSKLGVAGTLIGTALTGVMITLTSAILKVQLMKATDTISGIPSAVQGRLSTQQLRIPGKPNPEPNPEKPATQRYKAKRGRFSNLLSRLRAIPGFLKELPFNQRRKMLLAGLFAGLLATLIGLVSITGIEAVAGENLSCLVWSSSCSDETGETGPSGSSHGSGLSIFGGYWGTGSSSIDTQVAPSGGNPSVKQPPAPQNGQQPTQQPSSQQRPGLPGQPSVENKTTQQPSETPNNSADGATPRSAEEPAPSQELTSSQEATPSQEPGPTEEAAPDESGGGAQATSSPADQQSSPQEATTPQTGEVGNQKDGTTRGGRG